MRSTTELQGLVPRAECGNLKSLSKIVDCTSAVEEAVGTLKVCARPAASGESGR